MNATTLWPPCRRWNFWIAFVCAAAIHVGAIVLANGKSAKIALEESRRPAVDVDVLETPTETVPPEEWPPPPQPFSPSDDVFQEEIAMPRPVPNRTKPRVTSFVRGTAARLRTVKASVLYAPRPVYPYEARRQSETGSGMALLTIDASFGTVTNVRMTRSCGSVLLDNATLEALRRWRFRRGTLPNVEVPITYSLSGVSY